MGCIPGICLLLLLRRRSGIRFLESLELFAPLIVWEILSEFVGPGGTLANALMEPFYLGLTVSASQGVRLLFPGGTHLQVRTRFHSSVVFCILVGVGFALLFPDLPE